MISGYRQAVQPGYFTRQQAADYFGKSTKTIDRWIAQGRLTPVAGDGPRRRGVTTESVQVLAAVLGGAR